MSASLLELLSEHLRPAAGCGAQVDAAVDAGEDVELLIQVEQLVCRTRAVAVLLRAAEEDVTADRTGERVSCQSWGKAPEPGQG